MWICSYCGTENSDSSTECQLCGSYVTFERASVSAFDKNSAPSIEVTSHNCEDFNKKYNNLTGKGNAYGSGTGFDMVVLDINENISKNIIGYHYMTFMKKSVYHKEALSELNLHTFKDIFVALFKENKHYHYLSEQFDRDLTDYISLLKR